MKNGLYCVVTLKPRWADGPGQELKEKTHSKSEGEIGCKVGGGSRVPGWGEISEELWLWGLGGCGLGPRP